MITILHYALKSNSQFCSQKMSEQQPVNVSTMSAEELNEYKDLMNMLKASSLSVSTVIGLSKTFIENNSVLEKKILDNVPNIITYVSENSSRFVHGNNALANMKTELDKIHDGNGNVMFSFLEVACEMHNSNKQLQKDLDEKNAQLKELQERASTTTQTTTIQNSLNDKQNRSAPSTESTDSNLTMFKNAFAVQKVNLNEMLQNPEERMDLINAGVSMKKAKISQ